MDFSWGYARKQRGTGLPVSREIANGQILGYLTFGVEWVSEVIGFPVPGANSLQVELNPRLGKSFDLKFFHNGRPGIVAWTLM
jgi:hypothetical protein